MWTFPQHIRRGDRLPSAVAVAERHGLTLLHCDNDFEELGRSTCNPWSGSFPRAATVTRPTRPRFGNVRSSGSTRARRSGVAPRSARRP
ncbi:MAG: hypothetical protein DYH12_14970 [Sorangiineae bacterium PRO1]|nr:hypothetical protein [Sorangiineae bacterium PRO1]